MSPRWRLNLHDLEKVCLNLALWAGGGALVGIADQLAALQLEPQQQVVAGVFAGALLNLGQRLLSDYRPSK